MAKVKVYLNITDYLGLCKKCKHLSTNTKHPITILSSEYKNAKCLMANNSCYVIRNSLISCKYFKQYAKLSLFKRILMCLKYNSWNYLKDNT